MLAQHTLDEADDVRNVRLSARCRGDRCTPGGGGGVYNAGTLSVSNCTFSGNRTSFKGGNDDGHGGAIDNEGTGTVTVTSSTFSGNNADGGAPTSSGFGGAISNAGRVDVTSSTFSGNTATGDVGFGGAIWNGGTLNVTSSSFSGNTALGADGGAIDNAGTLTVTGTTFSGNDASDGGAIENTGTLNVTNSTFSGNTAPGDSGGAISNHGTLAVTNSTFESNSADGGGAISNNGALNVTSSTFYANSSPGAPGGAISNNDLLGASGRTTLTNTIVANSPPGGNCDGAIIDGGHNIDSDGICGVGPATDPMLDPAGLQNNGGPTQTIALLPGSPAIDAGDETVCAAAPVNGLDQRGYVRPGVGAANCSIGAYEFNSSGPPPSAPTPTPPPCVGDCNGNGQVTVADILALVNLNLGNGGACPSGVAAGVVPDVSLILQAVTNPLNGCPAQ